MSNENQPNNGGPTASPAASTAHTPVPWDFADKPDVFGDIFHLDENGIRQFVACCPKRYRTEGKDEEWRATARLLIAAPELLAALQGMMQFLETYPHKYAEDFAGYMDMAEDAIAKATGGAA